MKLFLTFWAVCLFAALSVAAADPVKKDESALALLRGVVAARTHHKSVRVDMVLDYSNRDHTCEISCLAEQSEGNLRFERRPGACYKDGMTVLVNDKEIRSFQRRPHADLEITDVQRAVRITGTLAFDPRILGLTGIIIPIDATVGSVLNTNICDTLVVAGKDVINGLSTWHVRATIGSKTTDLWVTEPLFRVIKIELVDVGTRTTINSIYDQPSDLPYPSRVEVLHETGTHLDRLKINVKRFEVGIVISPDRYMLKSLELPVNTMINDYRVKRIVGYWDGTDIVKSPVRDYSQGVGDDGQIINNQLAVNGIKSGYRLPLLAVSALFAIFLAALIVLRRLRRTRSHIYLGDKM